jgi:hypothetical protein
MCTCFDKFFDSELVHTFGSGVTSIRDYKIKDGLFIRTIPADEL